MTTERIPSSSLLQSLLLPLLILVVMLGATWLVWDHERQAARQEMRAQFDFALRDTVSRIEQRVSAYEQMLRGVQGLFATTGLTNRSAVRDYINALQLDANFSGIQVIGVVEKVPAAQKAAHVSAMRRRGFGNYAIRPDGDREMYAPIVQREPSADNNSELFGVDPWAEPVRRLAMEKARDSGMVAITGKVHLVSDKEGEALPGFIMYLPIFAPGQPRDSVVQRRTRIIGWVYVACHMSDFMASLYGKQVSGMALAIYDEANPVVAALMYQKGAPTDKTRSAQKPVLSANEYMVVAGRTWTITLGTEREFETRFSRDVASMIAVTGMVLSLSLALLGWFMATGRARALRLAAGMTEELRFMAQHDSLTGLPNRALFSDRLHQELAHARRHDGRFVLIFFDLDNFKPINDQYGHSVGDLLLQQVALRLQASVRASDTAGRIGGDEFVVLLPDMANAEDARSLAEKIRTAIRQPFIVEGHQLNISCSLGIAAYPEDGINEIALIKSADAAMYRAKERGRDSVQLAQGTT